MLGKLEKRRRFFASPYALYGDRVPKPGLWRAVLGLPEHAPLLLDIGCGKGEFAVYMAQQHPDWLVIGMERRADRLATGCRLAAEAHLQNVYFWHGDALNIEATFVPAEVSVIWLNYPDPYPKRRHEKHRLLHPKFLRLYARVLAPQGELYFRTDDPAFYEYALEKLTTEGWKVLFATPNLQPGEAEAPAYFETEFRQRKGGTIHYIHAQRP